MADDLAMYERLIAFLDAGGARYSLIDHAPEGRTELVSPMRGNPLGAAAKCLVVMVKIGRRTTRYVLGVVPGDTRIDVAAVRRLLGGTYASFASAGRAEQLAGSVSGTILPIPFDPALELVADPALLANERIYFNAARLDRSMALDVEDYVRLARPRVEPIAARDDPAAASAD